MVCYVLEHIIEFEVKFEIKNVCLEGINVRGVMLDLSTQDGTAEYGNWGGALPDNSGDVLALATHQSTYLGGGGSRIFSAVTAWNLYNVYTEPVSAFWLRW